MSDDGFPPDVTREQVESAAADVLCIMIRAQLPDHPDPAGRPCPYCTRAVGPAARLLIDYGRHLGRTDPDVAYARGYTDAGTSIRAIVHDELQRLSACTLGTPDHAPI